MLNVTYGYNNTENLYNFSGLHYAAIAKRNALPQVVMNHCLNTP